MNFLKNEPLSRHTTLKVGGPAQFFVQVKTEEQITEAVKFAKQNKLPIFILGGGSNVLVSDNGFAGLVIKIAASSADCPQPAVLGTTLNSQPSTINLSVTAEAAEEWDALVAWTVQNGLFGLENMSLIPGTVGGAVIGNIGAYGAELKDTLVSAEALEIRTGLVRRFSAQECQFAYRRSFFKSAEGRNFILLRATFALTQHGALNLAYKDAQDYFSSRGMSSPTLSDIRSAIIAIRQQKLPDLAQLGTAGSFFKNPVVPKEQYQALARRYPGLPGHPEEKDLVKIPLGWILDKVCGVKGLRQGRVGTHPAQALVLVSDGATASEIEAFAHHLARQVLDTTGLSIEWEVEKV